jgi:acylphosphatase
LPKGNPVAETKQLSRREVLFDGRVQGVGFRYTTRNIAGRFSVTGYVQNLPDGRVKLVAEGEPAEIDGFVAAVSAEMAQNIRGVQETTAAATGEFGEFEVRR